MSALPELRSRIADFVLGTTPLDEFYRWFVDRLWDIEQLSDPETKSAFYLVEGILAESSHAGWDESDMRREFGCGHLHSSDDDTSHFHRKAGFEKLNIQHAGR